MGGEMTEESTLYFDVIVVGGGNAAMCAALSAREKGARVLLMEKATPEDRGGNCPYTGGASGSPTAGRKT